MAQNKKYKFTKAVMGYKVGDYAELSAETAKKLSKFIVEADPKLFNGDNKKAPEGTKK